MEIPPQTLRNLLAIKVSTNKGHDKNSCGGEVGPK